MKKLLLSEDVAKKEWENFLDENEASSLLPNERNFSSPEELQNAKIGYDRIIKAIMYGNVLIQDGVINQKLKYPLKSDDDSVFLSELVYNHRWKAKDREQVFGGVKKEDMATSMIAQRKMLSKVTGVPEAQLGLIDGFDIKISDIIVGVFFT